MGLGEKIKKLFGREWTDYKSTEYLLKDYGYKLDKKLGSVKDKEGYHVGVLRNSDGVAHFNLNSRYLDGDVVERTALFYEFLVLHKAPVTKMGIDEHSLTQMQNSLKRRSEHFSSLAERLKDYNSDVSKELD